VVYDVTDLDSFNRLKRWINELRVTLPENLPILVAANKSDLQNRTVAKVMAQKFCDEHFAIHLETSAKMNKNVYELFYRAAKEGAKFSKNKPKPMNPRRRPSVIMQSAMMIQIEEEEDDSG
jgi:GTPase SAR1 family protein